MLLWLEILGLGFRVWGLGWDFPEMGGLEHTEGILEQHHLKDVVGTLRTEASFWRLKGMCSFLHKNSRCSILRNLIHIIGGRALDLL